MDRSISSSLTQTKTTTSTTTRGWSTWSRLGVWSATTTPYGTALWSHHLMPPSASMLGTTGTSCSSSTRLLLRTPGLRFACFLLVMASLSAVGSNDQPYWAIRAVSSRSRYDKRQKNGVSFLFLLFSCVFVIIWGPKCSCLEDLKAVPYWIVQIKISAIIIIYRMISFFSSFTLFGLLYNIRYEIFFLLH